MNMVWACVPALWEAPDLSHVGNLTGEAVSLGRDTSASHAVHDLQSELQSWLRGSAGLGGVFRSRGGGLEWSRLVSEGWGENLKLRLRVKWGQEPWRRNPCRRWSLGSRHTRAWPAPGGGAGGEAWMDSTEVRSALRGRELCREGDVCGPSPRGCRAGSGLQDCKDQTRVRETWELWRWAGRPRWTPAHFRGFLISPLENSSHLLSVKLPHFPITLSNNGFYRCFHNRYWISTVV